MSGMRSKGIACAGHGGGAFNERNRNLDACSNCYQSTTAVKVPIPVQMQLAGL